MQLEQVGVLRTPVDLREPEVQVTQGHTHGHIGQTQMDAHTIGLVAQAFAHGLQGGIHLSLSDIAVGCALGWLEFRFPEIGWRADYPNLAKLMDKLAQRPSFADTAPH